MGKKKETKEKKSWLLKKIEATRDWFKYNWTPTVTKRALVLLLGLLVITTAIMLQPSMPDAVTEATTATAKQAAMANLSWWTLHGSTVCWCVAGFVVLVLGAWGYNMAGPEVKLDYKRILSSANEAMDRTPTMPVEFEVLYATRADDVTLMLHTPNNQTYILGIGAALMYKKGLNLLNELGPGSKIKGSILKSDTYTSNYMAPNLVKITSYTAPTSNLVY